jgi:hypothetical protein
MYKPYAIFGSLAAFFMALGLFPFVRYGYLKLTDSSGSHIQSLLLGVAGILVAFLCVMLGIVSDLIRTNRMLIEDNLEHTKKMRFGSQARSAPSEPAATWPLEAVE